MENEHQELIESIEEQDMEIVAIYTIRRKESGADLILIFPGGDNKETRRFLLEKIIDYSKRELLRLNVDMQ